MSRMGHVVVLGVVLIGVVGESFGGVRAESRYRGPIVGVPFDFSFHVMSHRNRRESTVKDFRIKIDWGDGVIEVVKDMKRIKKGKFKVNSSHCFKKKGWRTIRVEVFERSRIPGQPSAYDPHWLEIRYYVREPEKRKR